MKIKKWTAYFIILLLFVTMSSGNYINAYGIDSADRVSSLGIMNVNGRQYSSTTREDFVMAIVKASGLEDEALSCTGTTIYSDVPKNTTLSGYVNVAVQKGLMLGMSDKKFHPEAKMNFAQICTLMVKALGYTDKDLQGTWPNNYIYKAKSLGLTENVILQKYDEVPLWVTALMFDKMLDANIKTSAGVDTSKTFADASGLTSESYKFGLIANPVYSKPVVASGISKDTSYLGNIYLKGTQTIIKNGQSAKITDIEDNDVIYQVSDPSGSRKYILVIDNKVSGKITAISSSKIQIDNKDYIFGSSFDYHKMLEDNDSLKVGEYATVLLGYDGKVVDYFEIGQQDNGNYAFVVNYAENSFCYTVKLLMIDGNYREYYTSTNPDGFKGRLVQFLKTSSDTVTLSYVTYNDSYTNQINKEAREINGTYVSHNVKIFNLVSDNAESTVDSDVKLISWYNLPNGDLTSGDILFLNKSAAYGDINVIVSKDLFKEEWKTGIVKSAEPVVGKSKDGSTDEITSYNYSIVVDGSIKSYKSQENIAVEGEPVKVKLLNNNIESVKSGAYLKASSYTIDAFDAERIKINNVVYYLQSNTVVYFVNKAGDYTLKSIADISIENQYQFITLFNESAGDNKVAAIVIKQ